MIGQFSFIYYINYSCECWCLIDRTFIVARATLLILHVLCRITIHHATMVNTILNTIGIGQIGLSHTLLSLSYKVRYKTWSNQTFPVYHIHIYIEFTPIFTYAMQSREDVQLFLGKNSFVKGLPVDPPADVLDVNWSLGQSLCPSGWCVCIYLESIIYSEQNISK